MKVVIFGGSGFLGSHVADVLVEKGHNVVIYDKQESKHLSQKQTMIVGDVLDSESVQRVTRGADVVYNFSGIADIEKANENPIDTVKNNILGHAIILDACRKHRVKRFVFASTLYVYGKSGGFYRSTKQACELLVENYHETFGLEYTILRYGSLYGPRADENNFIYHVLKQALKEKRIVRKGDGEEIREYIHIRDAAEASVDILGDDFRNQCLTITGDQPIKMKDLLLMIREILDNKVEIKYEQPESTLHYEITPYVFAPRLSKRIVNRTYVDFGQGILQCLQQIHKEIYSKPGS